jgi:hypothetical protein
VSPKASVGVFKTAFGETVYISQNVLIHVCPEASASLPRLGGSARKPAREFAPCADDLAHRRREIIVDAAPKVAANSKLRA